jgi:hypothetical protein
MNGSGKSILSWNHSARDVNAEAADAPSLAAITRHKTAMMTALWALI